MSDKPRRAYQKVSKCKQTKTNNGSMSKEHQSQLKELPKQERFKQQNKQTSIKQ